MRFYPEEQRYPTEEERLDILERNPEESATRGLWSDYEFLQRSSTMNPTLKKVQIDVTRPVRRAAEKAFATGRPDWRTSGRTTALRSRPAPRAGTRSGFARSGKWPVNAFPRQRRGELGGLR